MGLQKLDEESFLIAIGSGVLGMWNGSRGSGDWKSETVNVAIRKLIIGASLLL